MQNFRNIAVIDVGKTNAKIALFDLESFRESDVSTCPNDIVHDGLYPHHDIERMWEFFLDALTAMAATTRIDAIAISAHGASITLVDAEGNLALPMLDYEYAGPDSLAAEYDAIRPSFEETGTPRLVAGLNVGAQLYWQMKTFPDQWAGVASIMPYPQYWAFRLTGVRASERTSIGAHGDLWNPWKRDYSTFVEKMGWSGLMPPMSSPFDILGPIRPEIAARTGLAPATPVFSGLHDSNASLLPHLKSRETPFSVVSTGTWVICFSVGGKQVKLDEARDTLVNVNAFGDPVPSARFMGGRAFQMLKADARAPITDEDRDVVLGSPVMLLPAVPEDSGPFTNNKASWVGDPQDLSAGAYLYAVSLYLGLMTATSLELIGADGPVIVEGPLSANRTFLEALAAVTGRDIATGGGITGTSAGAACVALGRHARLPAGGRTEALAIDPRLVAYAARWRALAETHQFILYCRPWLKLD